MAGGSRRLVVTELYRMAGQGRLTVAEDGTVTVHDGAHPTGAADGVEKALIKAAGISRSERVGKWWSGPPRAARCRHSVMPAGGGSADPPPYGAGSTVRGACRGGRRSSLRRRRYGNSPPVLRPPVGRCGLPTSVAVIAMLVRPPWDRVP
ncbi:hypothetical protein [Streptomyces sp. SCL15-4]|uniref:hypothetical protein n=1 Tax=Streptomyces sp. SCL15-4 TaxID=2967221 RepID=UPI0039902370